MIRLKCFCIAVASGVLIAGPIGAIPATNADRDYIFPNKRGNRQFNWVVTDPDPNGLNCRMALPFQGVYLDSLEVPDSLRTNNIHEISEWSVLTVFSPGERLQAVTGNNANQIVLLDKHGKPWIPVETDQGHCFVRANSQFIEPIPEDPTTLLPLR